MTLISVLRSAAFAGIRVAALAASLVAPAHCAALLMVSIDGMKPEYVLEAEQRRLALPFLRQMLTRGTHASGVVGVWPTVTYPSHTTLITGVAPAQHGIVNNLEFDPKRYFADSWYWYSAQIKAPTLWSAAHRAGLSTASIGWPVTVGDTDIDWLIPEYWRIFRATADLNPSDRHLIAALSRPEGMLEAMQQSSGPYLMGNDTSVQADDIKTRYAEQILRHHHPRFMTLHLSSLDEAEHEHGPFSDAADRTLERIDELLSRLAAAARSVDPESIFLVVSDHGFVALTHRVNLAIPFIRAGLITVGSEPQSHAPVVESWLAQPWLAGGMAAIVVKDPHDAATSSRVRALLDSLAADPANGIDSVLGADDAAARGAFPSASFLVVMKPSHYLGTALEGDVVVELHDHGGHGFSPDEPSMRAAFFIEGKGIAPRRDLGVIDMRQIAPTVAGLLGISMPSAAAAPLSVRQ